MTLRKLVSGLLVLAAIVVLLPKAGGACSPSVFAETLVLEFQGRTIDGTPSEHPAPDAGAELTSPAPLESLVLTVVGDSARVSLSFAR